MKMKFKIGDKVKYVSGNFGFNDTDNPLWEYYKIAGTIIAVDKLVDLPYRVSWDNYTYNTYREDDLELMDNLPRNWKGEINTDKMCQEEVKNAGINSESRGFQGKSQGVL